MAHYAFLDDDNIVTEVIVGRDEDEVVDGITDWEAYYGELRSQRCLRTSYNTYGGQHNNGGTPFRKNYASIDFVYDEVRDAFIPPQPFPSWLFNEETCLWDAPVAIPLDDKLYTWDEDTVSWVQIELGD